MTHKMRQKKGEKIMERGQARVQALRNMMRSDCDYQEMLREYILLEERISGLSSVLSDEIQDVIWGMLCLSSDMNMQMVHIICSRFSLWDSILETYGEANERCTDMTSRA